MDGLQIDREPRADALDDIIPMDIPCPNCEGGELVIDAGDVRCDTCSLRAA